jgi:hypothetical protein
MGHVLFRRWQPRAAVILGVFFSFAVFTGAARATTTTSNSGATVCVANPGSCAWSGDGTANFSGEFDTPYQNPDPIACLNQAADSTDSLCGHFGLDFNNVGGKVNVSITGWDPNRADLDLCIINSLNQVVGCSTGMGGSESISFTVACGDKHFEAQILPSMFLDFFNPPTPVNPVTYTGGVTTSLTVCIGGGTGGGGQSSAGGHKISGGGKVSQSPGGAPTANFSLNVMDSTSGFKGKVQFSDSTGCVFRASIIDAVSWHDESKSADIFGHGFYKTDPNTLVSFHAFGQDNGEGASTAPPGDIFTIDACPNQGGPVVSGNILYHFA